MNSLQHPGQLFRFVFELHICEVMLNVEHILKGLQNRTGIVTAKKFSYRCYTGKVLSYEA